MNEPTCTTDKYGNKEWRLNGKRHRTDGPAVEYTDGTKEWYLNDVRHRVDGPAIENANSHKQWWLNGKLHRTDGPAVEFANGHKQWWLNNRCVTEEEFNMSTLKNSKHIQVANMPEGFQVLSLETHATKFLDRTCTELVVTIQTPDGVAKVEIPLDENLKGTLGLNFVTPGHYY